MHARFNVALLLALIVGAPPALAQGKPRHYVVTTDRAIVVTREVLGRQGFEVVRIEETGPVRTIWYRRGNMGRGKGKGRLEKLVLRRVEDRIVFEETPAAILIDIDVRLKLP